MFILKKVIECFFYASIILIAILFMLINTANAESNSELEEMEPLPLYKNPFDIQNAWFSEGELGDPFVMRFNGRFYLYCSGWDTYLKCWSSETLVDWKYEGEVARGDDLRVAYAPEVVYARDGYFYMVTSTPEGSGHRLLRAKSPLGPFEFITENFGRMIDGSLFFDDDGKEYFYHASHTGIKSNDVKDYIEFGYDKNTGAYLGHWTEGPQVFKRNGLYFMTFTGNHVLSEGYRIAYAVSDRPDTGFVMPRNSELVINTTDKYWALGHNSVVMGPDMDSYYIAFHNNRLYPPLRKFNLDRLFFNGRKLTTTAPNNWEQPAPALPEFYAWADEGKGGALETNMISGEKYKMSKAESNDNFIAEWNISSGNLFAIFSYKDEKNYGLAELEGSVLRLSEMCDGKLKVISEGKVPGGSEANAHHALRLEKSGNKLDLFYDGMHRLAADTRLSGGQIGASVSGGALRYIAFSNTSGGESDFSAPKSIPGAFDAVHYLKGKGTGYQSEGVNLSSYRKEDTVDIRKTQSGSYAVMLKNEGDWLRYAVSVKETGRYAVDVRLGGEFDGAELLVKQVNGEESRFELKDSGLRDKEGFTVITLEGIELERGFQTFEVKLEKGKDILFESFSWYRSEVVDKVNEFIVDSKRAKKEGWKFMGKIVREFNQTENGYIPNHIQSRGFTGETGWLDYGIDATIKGGLDGTSGNIQLYFRSANESWHEAQVIDSFIGYRLTIAPRRITLDKCRYNSRRLEDIKLENELSGDLHFRVLVKGQDIQILLNGAPVIKYSDPDPITHGRVGIGGTNLERGFSELSVFPMNDSFLAAKPVSASSKEPAPASSTKPSNDSQSNLSTDAAMEQSSDRDGKFPWIPSVLTAAAGSLAILISRYLKKGKENEKA